MAVNNIYKHNARSYYDVYTPLVNAYPRKPTWMFKEMSGMFDHQSELMNAIATDILYPQTRESAYSFAQSCDYDPVEADGATDTLTITLTSAVAKTLAIGYQVGGISTSTGKMVIYETTATASSGGTNTISVAAKQKRTQTSRLLFTIINSDDFYDYPVDGYTNIIKSTFSLVINSVTWTRVDNFDNSTATDTHFMLIYQSSGRVRVRFGDDVTGMKPTINDSVYGTFETTDGLLGRMDAGTININVGSDSQIKTVTNAGSVGGNDSETITSIIRNSRANVRIKGMVWTVADLADAARAASATVVKALGVPGTGSASVYVVPSGGLTAGAGLLSTVTTYVQALTQFGAMPITSISAIYVPVNITASITVRSGFTAATVRALVAFALTLASMANDNEILEYYLDWGIDLCRSLVINTLYPSWAPIWSSAFTSAENDALETIILKWQSLLGSRESREWAQALEIGDLWTMGNCLYDYGGDVFSLTTPAANTTATALQIINTGTVTVS